MTKAAESLFVSQPLLSKYLSTLENALGVELFYRSRRPMSLTPAGELYRRHLEQVSEMEAGLLASFSALNDTVTHDITLAMGHLNASILMPLIVADVAEKLPALRISALIKDNASCGSAIKDGEADFALLFYPKRFNGIRCEVIHNETIMLVGSSSHSAIASGRPLRLADLKDETFFIPPQNLILHAMTLKILRSAMGTLPKLIPTPNIPSAVNMASTGRGFCFIIGSFAKASFYPAGTLTFPIRHPKIEIPLAMAWNRSRRLSETDRSLIDIMKDLYSRFHENTSSDDRGV